jgi:hypothetical protein
MTLAAVNRLVHHATIFELNVGPAPDDRRAQTIQIVALKAGVTSLL